MIKSKVEGAKEKELWQRLKVAISYPGSKTSVRTVYVYIKMV